MKKLFKSFIILFSYIVTLLIGFGLGIYFLPIITAEKPNTFQEINKVQKKALYKSKFSKGQRGNDFLHWGEGNVSISNSLISLDGKIAPGPDYKVYLLNKYVEHEDEFLPIKSEAKFVANLNTFENFIVKVPSYINIREYNTILIWCEKFKEFITSAKYK